MMTQKVGEHKNKVGEHKNTPRSLCAPHQRGCKFGWSILSLLQKSCVTVAKVKSSAPSPIFIIHHRHHVRSLSIILGDGAVLILPVHTSDTGSSNAFLLTSNSPNLQANSAEIGKSKDKNHRRRRKKTEAEKQETWRQRNHSSVRKINKNTVQ